MGGINLSVYKINDDKPELGIPKDVPEQNAAARFFQLLFRNIGNLIKLNFLVLLCIVPSQVFLFILLKNLNAVKGLLFWGALALLIPFSLLVGPAMTAASFCISKMLRNDPVFLWYNFKKTFLGGFKQTAVFGMVYLLLTGIQLRLLFSLEVFNGHIIWLSIFGFLTLLFHMMSPHYYLQAGYLVLKPIALLKNSLLLALGRAPRSVMSALSLLLVWVTIALLFPFSFIPAILIGYTVPSLLSIMWIWPIVNEACQIEKQLSNL